MIALRHDENLGTAGIGLSVPSKHAPAVARMKTPAAKKSAGKKAPAVATGISPKELRLLRESFAQIAPQAHIAALEFYRNLFSLDPSLRGMFHTNIELQGRKLMEALGFTVATLENPQALLPELEAMGRRHLTYGVQDKHYDTVLAAMMLTLQGTLGKSFTPEMREAWEKALGLVADTMKRGAATVTALTSTAA